MARARTAPGIYRGRTAEERRAARRAALVTAAMTLWGEHGWAAVTMRGVCTEARLTDRYFYESFADRDDLLTAVWDEVSEDLVARMLAAIALPGDRHPVEQLRVALAAVLDRITEEPTRARIFFGDHAGSAVLQQRRRQSLQLFTDLVVSLTQPYLRPDADETGLRMHVLVGVGGFTEVLTTWLGGHLDVTAERLVETMTAVGADLGRPYLRAEFVEHPS